MFTCIDCKKDFKGFEYEQHNSCISEQEKYMGKFYVTYIQKPKSAKASANSNSTSQTATSASSSTEITAPVKRSRLEWRGWKNSIKDTLKEAGPKGLPELELKNSLISKYQSAGGDLDSETLQEVLTSKLSFGRFLKVEKKKQVYYIFHRYRD